VGEVWKGTDYPNSSRRSEKDFRGLRRKRKRGGGGLPPVVSEGGGGAERESIQEKKKRGGEGDVCGEGGERKRETLKGKNGEIHSYLRYILVIRKRGGAFC